MTVPPAESIVKLPVEVSISLSSVTPIWTLSIFAPSFASIAPVNVDTPVTFNWSVSNSCILYISVPVPTIPVISLSTISIQLPPCA